MEEDEEDGYGADVLDEGDVDVVEGGGDGAPVGELVAYNLSVHTPGNEDAGEETADGEEYLSGDEVEEVEEGHAEELETLPCTEAEGAEAAEEAAEARDDGRCPTTGDVELLVEERRADLVERDKAGEGGEGEESVEEKAYGSTDKGNGGKGLLEDCGEGDEDERGTAVGLDAGAEGCGENHKACKDGHEGVDEADLDGRLEEVGLAVEVGGKGAEAAHCDAQRVESLTEGGKEERTAELREVGTEEELDASGGTGEHARSDNDDEEEDEEQRHEELRGLLDSSAYAARNNKMSAEEEYDGPDEGTYGVGLEGVEVVGDVLRVAKEMTEGGGVDVLKTPAGDNGIVARDEEAREDAHSAYGGPELSASRDAGIGTSGIGLACTTDDELADDAGNAEHHDADEIEDEENGTTVFARHVGETPYVAQAHSGAGSSEDDSQAGAETGA